MQQEKRGKLQNVYLKVSYGDCSNSSSNSESLYRSTTKSQSSLSSDIQFDSNFTIDCSNKNGKIVRNSDQEKIVFKLKQTRLFGTTSDCLATYELDIQELQINFLGIMAQTTVDFVDRRGNKVVSLEISCSTVFN